MKRAQAYPWSGSGWVVTVDDLPRGGTLPQQEAERVARWLNDGALEEIERRAIKDAEQGFAEHNNQAQARMSEMECEILTLRERATRDLTELRDAWTHYADHASSSDGHLDGCPGERGACDDQACGLGRVEYAILDLIAHIPSAEAQEPA